MRTKMSLEVSALLADGEPRDESLLDRVAVIVAEALGMLCVIAVVDDDGAGGEMHPVGLHHIDRAVQREMEEHPTLTWPARTGVTARVLRAGKPEVLGADERQDEPRPPGWDVALRDAPSRGAVVAPLRVAGRCTGILSVVRPATWPPFSEQDVAAVQQVANQVALVVENRRLEDEIERLRSPYQPRLPEPRFANLTSREVEILGLIGEGLTNRDIAERLFLSVRTVEWHRARLTAKLGVHSRSELIALGRSFSG